MTRIQPLLLSLALVSGTAFAQTSTPAAKTPAKPATPGAKATSGAHPAVTPRTGVAGVKLPAGVPAGRGILKTAFALRYQDTKIGEGAVAESGKLYHVKYTGWLASDGKKFDSSDDHPGGQPFSFQQGRGRVIPGWDMGFDGMKIGGKRRLFIPYQLAYGIMGQPPVIPPKSDLIFDIELIGVEELPTGNHPLPVHPTPPPAGQPAQPGSQPVTPPNPQSPAKPADPTKPTAVPPADAPKPSNPAQPQ